MAEAITDEAGILDLKAHAIVLALAVQAIGGKDISDIRHSDGDIDLARRVVKLQAAAQNLLAALPFDVAALVAEHSPKSEPAR